MPINTNKLVPFTAVTFTRNSVRVTIGLDGTITFWSGAIVRYNLQKVTHMIFYYDPENAALCIQPSNSSNASAKPFRTHGRKNQVSCKPMFEFFNITVKQPMVYDLLRDSASGLLYVELKNGKPTYKSNPVKNGGDA